MPVLRVSKLTLLVLLLFPLLAAADTPLQIPAQTKFINGTGQIPIIGSNFKAPGFTSQGYIEIRERAGPHVYFVGLSTANVPITVRNSCKTAYDGNLIRLTYANRNRELGLKNPAEETVVQPYQFYVSDPVDLSVKPGDEIYLRTFVPLDKDTTIGCGTISVSQQRPDGRWPYGNVVSDQDLTMDPNLEAQFKPTSDLLYTPFLVAGENVRPDAKFLVAFGDSLTFQLTKDKDGTWFQDSFKDTPHANLAIGGDALGNLFKPDGQLSSPLQEARFAIAAHATDIINFYGHNDLGNGRTVEDMIRLEKLICARPEIAKARKWRATLTPFTHNKTRVLLANLTEADQTPDKTSDAILDFNRQIRTTAKAWGYTGTLEIGAALATGPDSPFWKPGLANDGTHFSRAATPLITPVVREILR